MNRIMLCSSRDEVQSILKDHLQKDVYVDIEGVNLGRNGEICLLQMTFGPDTPIIILDVVECPDILENGVRDILESKNICKYMWDPRADSDALYNRERPILLENVVCLQLAEISLHRLQGMTRNYLSSLGSALQRVLPSNTYCKMYQIKESGRNLFSPEKGGNYQVFLDRPLNKSLLTYSALDVAFLPDIKKKYYDKLPEVDKNWVIQKSQERINLALSDIPLPKGRSASLAPF